MPFALTKAISTKLNRSDRKGHSDIVPDHREKPSFYHGASLLLFFFFLVDADAFYQMKQVKFYFKFAEVGFFWGGSAEIDVGFVKSSESIEMTICFSCLLI